MKRLSRDYLSYLKLMDIIWLQNDEVPLCLKALYMILLRYENIKTLRCDPCQETIAHHLKTSSKSISKWAKELENIDWLRIKKIRTGAKMRYSYDLYAPQPNTKYRGSSGRKKNVIYPFPEGTNSTPSTIQESGFLGFTSEQ